MDGSKSDSEVSEGISAKEFYEYEYNPFFDPRHSCVYVTDSEEKELLLKVMGDTAFAKSQNFTINSETFIPIYDLDYFNENDDSVTIVPRWGYNYKYSAKKEFDRQARVFAVKVYNGEEKAFQTYGCETDGESAIPLLHHCRQKTDASGTIWADQSFDYAENAKRIKNILKRDTFVDPRNVKLVLLAGAISGYHSPVPLFYIKDEFDECFIEAGMFDEDATSSWEQNDYIYSVEDVAEFARGHREEYEMLHYYSKQEVEDIVGLHGYVTLKGHSAGIQNPADLTADSVENTWEYLQEGMQQTKPSDESSSPTDVSEASENSAHEDSSASDMRNSDDVAADSSAKTNILIALAGGAVAVVAVVVVFICVKRKRNKSSRP